MFNNLIFMKLTLFSYKIIEFSSYGIKCKNKYGTFMQGDRYFDEKNVCYECICGNYGHFECYRYVGCRRLNCTLNNLKSCKCCIELKCQGFYQFSKEICLEKNDNSTYLNKYQIHQSIKAIIGVTVVIIVFLIIIVSFYLFKRFRHFNNIERHRPKTFREYVKYVRPSRRNR